MTQPITASVIVVSRNRAAALVRCLKGLAQQDHPQFEIIVVADPDGVKATQTIGLPIKTVAFDQANISAARNAGLAIAAAPVVVFIDDDAVGEPTWLSRLTAPFIDPQVIAATGFVLGRNGFSFQWQACFVNALGQDQPLAITKTTLLGGTAELAVKTQGTNCAFRKSSLLAIGGFDPAYRFFLDEADVNLRMAHLGATAIVPDALVHHGFAASDRRRADRVPLSLFDIAASTAVFLRRHAPHVDLTASFGVLKDRESARARHHLVAGHIGTVEVTDLLISLGAGWTAGLQYRLLPLPALQFQTSPFIPIPDTGPKPGKVIFGRSWQRNHLIEKAKTAITTGQIVTMICLSPSFRAHQMQFQTEGFWLQTGGLFGRSVRLGSRVVLMGFNRRVAQETKRIAAQRPVL